MPERWILKGQKGTALVIALLVMITATVVAIGVNFSTTTEVAISRNQRQYTADFFRADGGLELVKTYFLENFCFPSNLDEEKNVGQDLLDEGRDNSPFVDLGLDNVIYFLYWTLMEGTNGQSIGKIVMKLKVTQLNGNRLDMVQAAIEGMGKAFLLPLDVIIGLFLYPNKKQRLFNYISGTIVLKA